MGTHGRQTTKIGRPSTGYRLSLKAGSKRPEVSFVVMPPVALFDQRRRVPRADAGRCRCQHRQRESGWPEGHNCVEWSFERRALPNHSVIAKAFNDVDWPSGLCARFSPSAG